MPTTTLHFGPAGVEDLEIGTGTFSAKTSDGREITLNKINLSSFIHPLAINKAIYFTNGSQVGQDSSFTYDTATKDMVIAGGQLMVGGASTADRTLHVAESGAVYLRLENESVVTGNVGLEWAINGSVDWNLACIDNDNDNLVLSSTGTPSTTPHMTCFRDSGTVAIGTRTQSSFVEQGLVIDSGSNQDHILEFQNTGVVAHGMTDHAGASTYGYVRTAGGSGEGGLILAGLTESIIAMNISGLATSETTTSSDAASANITLRSYLKSGATVGPHGNTANLLLVANDNTSVVIIKGDGDVHNSGGSTAMTTYDDFDDVKLLQAVKGVMDISYQHTLGEWIGAHTDILQQTGVIRRDEGNTWFISQRGWRGLVIDAMRQLSGRIDALEAKFDTP